MVLSVSLFGGFSVQRFAGTVVNGGRNHQLDIAVSVHGAAVEVRTARSSCFQQYQQGRKRGQQSRASGLRARWACAAGCFVRTTAAGQQSSRLAALSGSGANGPARLWHGNWTVRVTRTLDDRHTESGSRILTSIWNTAVLRLLPAGWLGRRFRD